MPRAADSVANDIASRARGLSSFVSRQRELHSQGVISQLDLNRVHAGAFIAFQAYVEQSLDELFFAALMGRVTFTEQSVRPLVVIRSDKVARSVVHAGRRYVDWLPYNEQTKKRAEAYLSGGRPFTSLPAPQRQVLDRMSVLRNALAHEGSHALKRFRGEFTEGKALPVDQRRPAGYLQGQHRVGVTRFEYLLAEAIGAVRALCR